MASYECVVILDPSVNDEEAVKEFEGIKRRFVNDAGCAIVGEDAWGRRKLAYPIRKRVEGNYFIVRLTHENTGARLALEEVQRYLRFSEAVLRHMVVRIPDAMASAAILRPPAYAPPTYGGRPPYGERSAPAPAREAPKEAAPAEGAAAPAEGAAPAAEAPAAAAAEPPAETANAPASDAAPAPASTASQEAPGTE